MSVLALCAFAVAAPVEIGVGASVGPVAPQGEAADPAYSAYEVLVRARPAATWAVELWAGAARGGAIGRGELAWFIGSPSGDVVPRLAAGVGWDGLGVATDLGAGLDVGLFPSLDARIDARARVRPARGGAESALVFTAGLMVHSARRYDGDRDGVTDRLDRCVAVSEDVDGFEDDDGCPDVDDDRDGIPDALDACPRVAEDRDGFLDADGCPEPDNDNDGLTDARDACNNVPEDLDAFEDGDGCPDPDDDGDGVPDTVDLCRRTPEDPDGYEDGDGCPEPDNDGDGVGDRFDLAPNDPETLNGWEDNDGVPDTLPPVLLRFTGPQPKVKFRDGVLTERGQDAAEVLADVLVTYPEVRVTVKVTEPDVALATERAATFAAALVAGGVRADRLVPIGEEGDPGVRLDVVVVPF